MVYTSFIVLLTCFTPVTLSKLYEHISDLPGLDYDFVIVGGGTAGNVVANRLTENPEFSVLVLEAGVSNEGLLASDAPFLLSGLFGKNNLNWNYTTTPQAGLNHRVIKFPRTHILGGCTAQNAMFYTRGTAEDFDRYADLTGDLGWSWNRVFPYFLKNEKWSPPADDHNTHGQFNPAFHSTQGETSVSLNGFSWSTFEQKVLQTTQQLPDEFPFNLDMNSGRPLGVGWLQSTIGGGRRSSSATSYLGPKYIQRKNLHVLLHAQVSKLVDAEAATGKLRFGGVQFRHDSSLFTAKASKEIILSAGPVGTPHILMNSGIGDRNILDAAGVHTILDLPSVGKNASDHPHFLTSWSVNSTETTESISQNATRFNEALEQWKASHTGPLVEFGTTHIAWLRLDPDAPIFEAHTDPSAGPETPHIELFFTPNSHTGAKGHFMNIAMVLVSPVSRGSVSINSSDPFDPPLIDPGLLTSDFDLFALREAFKRAQRFVSAPAWRDYIIAPIEDLENMTTAALEQHIRNTAVTAFHIVGTAGMSAPDAEYGVVDPDLRVKGVRGLRVIDASVLPIVPSAHTQAPAYVVGERGADLVKQSWQKGCMYEQILRQDILRMTFRPVSVQLMV